MTSKLSQAKDEGLITQIVQKFDMHMKNFDSDKNTQLRWVWQLIQNAKDAPNDFEQSKIKQELNDTQFISKHNGNAFTIRQIHSVVAQYSTKQQNNDQSKKTTGKYGTGFITTFLIGKVVSIDGYIRIEVDDEEGNDMQKKIKMQEVENNKPDSVVVEESKKKRNKKSEEKIKQVPKNTFYYKKFQFPLDRYYEQRDKQLKKKVQRGDQLLVKAVFQGQMEREALMSIPQNQVRKNKHKFQHHFNYVDKRTVDSYNTSFAYTVQDKQKIPIIETAMLNVQRLMPYAMLFNEKLQFYQFLDIRTKNRNNMSFSIEKVSLKLLKNTKKSNNFHLFTYLFKSQYDIKLKKFKKQQKRNIVAFLSDQKRVYAAIPVLNCGINWIIQNIERGHCQIFKDFPLIGSAQIEWNAVINSDNFYPNEKRSELMLSHLDKLSQSKVAVNKSQLQNCFEGIKQLYLFLALEYCVGGWENLLIFNNKNIFTKQFPLFQRVLKSIIDTFLTTKFISTGQKGNTKCSLQQLIFIELSQNDEKIHKKTETQMSLSSKINQTFRFLFQDKHVLSQQIYQDFYAKLHKGSQNKDTYIHNHKIAKINSIEQCLKMMEEKGYTWLKRRFMGNLFPKLNEIYTLLVENRIQFGKCKIVLNENNEFKSIVDGHLKVKKIDPVVEQIFIFLEIEIKKYLIKEEFTKVFIINPQQKYFNDEYAASNILYKLDKLLEQTQNSMKQYKALRLLFALILTLNQVPSNSGLFISLNKESKAQKQQKKKQDKKKELPIINLEKIKKFKSFSQVQPFKLFGQIKDLAELKKHLSKKLYQMFNVQFVKYFQSLQMQYQGSFIELCTKQLNIHNEDQGVAFFLQLFSDSLLGEKLASLSMKVTLDNTFSQSYNIYKLAENIAFPNEQDVQIYQILRFQTNNNHIKPIKQRLIMPIYQNTQNIKVISYSQLFNNVKSSFNSLNEIKKYKVLSYVKSIHEQFTKTTYLNPTIAQKHKAWKDVIDSRVTKMFQLKNSLKTFESEPIKEFLYDIFDNQHELKKAAEEYGKRSRPTGQISESVISNDPHKKLKIQ